MKNTPIQGSLCGPSRKPLKDNAPTTYFILLKIHLASKIFFQVITTLSLPFGKRSSKRCVVCKKICLLRMSLEYVWLESIADVTHSNEQCDLCSWPSSARSCRIMRPSDMLFFLVFSLQDLSFNSIYSKAEKKSQLQERKKGKKYRP